MVVAALERRDWRIKHTPDWRDEDDSTETCTTGRRVFNTRSLFEAAVGWFCEQSWGRPTHLSPQRDALGELLDGQLVVEVALFGRAAEPADDGSGGEDDNDEEAQAVDEDLQVRLRGKRRGWQLCSDRVKTNKQTMSRLKQRQAKETKSCWGSACVERTVHYGEPRRVVRDADGVPRQAGVLPRVIGSDVLQSENLHVLVRRVHTCSLYREAREI